MAKDYDLNNNSTTDFYVWIDAGIAPYRDTQPPSVRLNLKNINSLPHDKICYSFVSEDYHNFSAGVLIMHKNIIDNVHDLYYNTLNQCNIKDSNWVCGSDQIIFTKMIKLYPELFYKMSDGYGENLTKL